MIVLQVRVILEPHRNVVLGEVEALDTDGEILLCFVLRQLVVNHPQVVCCSATRLQRLFLKKTSQELRNCPI